MKRRSMSPASPMQKGKVKGSRCIVTGFISPDPAHLWPRGLGGCDSQDCVVPLTRTAHRAYDAGKLDLLPYLIEKDCMTEMQHALGHAGSPLRLLERLTGTRWVPRDEAA